MATGFNACDSLSGWTEEGIGAGTQFTVSGGAIVVSGESLLESLSLDAAGADTENQDIEILFKYRTSAWNSTHAIGIARGSDAGSSSTQAGYYVALRSTAIRTYYKNSGGALTQIASTTISTLSVSTDYWVRLRVNHSSTNTVIQARVWVDGGSEPGTWTCDTTTAAGPGVVDGYAGLYTPNNSTHTWGAFGYGTAGDTAPASASAGVTVAPGAGAAVALGYAPVVGQSVAVAPGAGAGVVLGYAPDIAQPISVAPGAGAGVALGYAPVVGQPVAVAPGAGAEVALGYAPVVGQVVGIAPSVGAVIAAGTVPTIGQPHTLIVGSANSVFSRPEADLAAGTFVAAGGGALFAAVDEAVANDSDYIYNTTNNFVWARVKIAAIADPGTDTGHTVRYRAWNGGATPYLFLYLHQGDTVIASVVKQIVSTTPTDYTYTLTPGQAAAITDYSALEFRLLVTGGTTYISQFAVEVAQITQIVPLGYAPDIAQPISVAPGAGAAVALGYAPVVGQPVAVAPGAGAEVALGYAPVVGQVVGIAPSVGAVVAAGTVPTIGQPHTLTVGSEHTIYARPDGTIDGVGFTPVGAATIHECLNEATPNDATFIYGSSNAVVVSLQDIADPGISTGHVVRFRGMATNGWIAVVLQQGDTQIASKYYYGAFPTVWTDDSFTLTEAEANAITDYSDLRLSFAGLIGTTYLSWAEFSVERSTQVDVAGQAPSVAQVVPSLVAPGVGGLAALGLAPIVGQAHVVAPDAGVANVTGAAPAIAQPHIVSTTTGSYSVLGAAPEVVQSTILVPAEGYVSVAGYAPVLGQPHVVAPETCAAVYSGYLMLLGSPVEYARYLAGVRVYYSDVDVVVSHTPSSVVVTQGHDDIRVVHTPFSVRV